MIHANIPSPSLLPSHLPPPHLPLPPLPPSLIPARSMEPPHGKSFTLLQHKQHHGAPVLHPQAGLRQKSRIAFADEGPLCLLLVTLFSARRIFSEIFSDRGAQLPAGNHWRVTK